LPRDRKKKEVNSGEKGSFVIVWAEQPTKVDQSEMTKRMSRSSSHHHKRKRNTTAFWGKKGGGAKNPRSVQDASKVGLRLNGTSNFQPKWGIKKKSLLPCDMRLQRGRASINFCGFGLREKKGKYKNLHH